MVGELFLRYILINYGFLVSPKWMAGLHNALTFKPWGTTLQVPTNYGLLVS